MSDVFLSYARADRERIKPLVQALAHEGLQVFWDRDEIEMTRGATRQIDEEIRQSGVVLLILTEAATTSKFLAEEADLALSLGTLLPIRFDAVDGGRYLYRIRSIQNLDLVDWNYDANDRRFRFLVDEVKRRLNDRQSPWDSAPSPAPSVPPFLTHPTPAPPPPSVTPTPAPAPPPPVSFPAPASVQPPAASASSLPPQVIAPPVSAGSEAVPQAVPSPVPVPAGKTPASIPAYFGVQPPDVFVAYSRKDSETCRKIVTELRSQGLNVFYDQYIQGGEEWRDMLAWNIKNCSVLMVLFTANSKNSPQVRKEVNLATSHSKSIIPVMIENVALEGGLELELNGINFIPYYDDPTARLAEAVEKAKTLAAITVFERRRQGVPDGSLPALGMPFTGGTQSAPVRNKPVNWLQGTLAIVGGVLLSGSTALLTTNYSGANRAELLLALAIALFFIAFPYTIAILLLYKRLLRDQ